MRRFIVLATQRSGSTWMVDMLDSHPNVVAYSELFLQGGQGTPTWGGTKDRVFWETFLEERGAPATGLRSVPALFRYLSYVYAPRRGVDAVGVKLMYGQSGAHTGLTAWLALRRVAVVHLVRRNLLDVVVSREHAAARDLYHARADTGVEAATVRLDPATLLDQLATLEREERRYAQRFRRLRGPYLEVGYEDLAADRARFADVLRFLGVRDAERPLESSLRRLVESSRREVIENHDAVADALAGTRFARYLE